MQVNLKHSEFLQSDATGSENFKARATPELAETPHQTAGPFYPGENTSAGNDLTVFASIQGQPLGQVVYVKGAVQDEMGVRIADVKVEIWQACASGRYNNPIDTNTAPLDPNFQYWGETSSDKMGSYQFKTIIPGAYPNDPDWLRPPHIHFRLSKGGYHELITQMYFKGDPLNDIDKILLAVPAELRDGLVIDFQPTPNDPTTKTGFFTITMLKMK